MTARFEQLAWAAIAALALGGFATASAPTAAASKQELDADVRQATQELYKTSSAAKELAGRAAGMLVFPSIIKGGFVVGGEYG